MFKLFELGSFTSFSFECLNSQGLKTNANVSFRDDVQQWQVNCPERLLSWPRPRSSV